MMLDERGKKLMSMYRRKLRLIEARRAYNWVELEKPERHGYKKTFEVREDIAKGFPNMLPVLKDILKLCNYEITSRDKKFLRRDYKTKKMVPVEHKLKYIMPREWEKLPSDKHRSLFKLEYMHTLAGKPFQAYVVDDQWMFVSKIRPYYITHRLVLDPKLDSELKEIENKIERNYLWPQLANEFSWSWKPRNSWADASERMHHLIRALDLDYRKYIVDGE